MTHFQVTRFLESDFDPDIERALMNGMPLDGQFATVDGFTVHIILPYLYGYGFLPRNSRIARVEVRYYAPEFRERDADAVMLRRGDDVFFARHYVFAAVFQAWSVPICDDLRRHIYSFLVDPNRAVYKCSFCDGVATCHVEPIGRYVYLCDQHRTNFFPGSSALPI